jgi:hypothetical protein
VEKQGCFSYETEKGTIMTIRNRIKTHRRVRAGDLVPHELNWRLHPEHQRQALAALYQEVGFARSLLAYELPDGRLKLIDGHLRRDLDPNLEVDVEVLDVNDAEARKLLLSMDSLAGLAQTDAESVEKLTALTRADAPVLNDLWQSLARAADATRAALDRARQQPEELPEEKFLILIDCGSEAEQVDLLRQLQERGISCRALVS